MKPIQVPSQNSRQDSETLSKFLENSDFRKLYCDLLKVLKKYKNLEANNCLTKEIIPKSFLVQTRFIKSLKEIKKFRS